MNQSTLQELTQFRREVDYFLQQHPDSPLSNYQKSRFTGLDYYQPDEAFVFQTTLDFFPKDEPVVEMATSTGDTRHYRRWAKFAFEVEGQAAELVIYSDPWGESLFLPFKDATNGSETYGAGRYMDNHRPGLWVHGESLIIDFNYSYNPYCAYSEAYSCPLPPRENWVAVPIRAGEKNFE
ncbi:MAG: DUF1684 domain-containing protein [Ardenticatenaceae bacterium]|nr:DUF1684 domain-containing protein [Ardenticatenaceae bacterium]